jgi:hypothetical protein
MKRRGRTERDRYGQYDGDADSGDDLVAAGDRRRGHGVAVG